MVRPGGGDHVGGTPGKRSGPGSTYRRSGPPPVVPAVVLAPIPADGEIERFLKEAEVVSTKSTKKGVTDSLRATLSDGKLTHEAHIQTHRRDEA